MSDQITPDTRIIKPSKSSRRSSKRYTPYHKTPKSRFLHVTPVVVRGPDKKAHHDRVDATAIAKKTFRVYRVSPLYDFSSTPAKLKKYSKFLSAHMEAETMKGFAVGLEADVAKNATISVFRGLTVNQNDPQSLHITIRGKQPKADGKEFPVVLEAFLVSVNIDKEAMSVVKKEFTYYPVMLVKGAKTLTGYLCAFLEMEFDCHIKEMEFSSANLRWMTAMWSGFVPDRSRRPVQLVFKVPNECQGLSQLSLAINAEDCKDLWQCISDEDSEEFLEEQVDAFFNSLESHFYQHFKIRLGKLTLKQTATAIAQAAGDGKLKIFSETHLKIVLQFLTQLSWERFMESVLKNH